MFQLGDHDKALRIFVQKMKDFKAAEDYCDQVRYRIFLISSSLFLNLVFLKLKFIYLRF
jgi:hypothetical protein